MVLLICLVNLLSINVYTNILKLWPAGNVNLLAFGHVPNHVVGHVYRRLGLSASLNKTFPSFTTTGIIQRFRQWRSKIGGVGARGRHLYKGGNFARKCISTTPDRGAHIYLAPGGNTPGGVGARRRQLYRGDNFAHKCISTTPIYIWPRVAIPPCSATGFRNTLPLAQHVLIFHEIPVWWL